MTKHLTAPQEAAFNAAGEAMQDLDTRFYCGRPDHSGKPFAAWCDHPHRRFATLWGYGDTLAEAVAEMFRELEKAEKEPPLFTSAAEAKEAAKKIVDEVRNADELNPLALDEIADRIAALPVKD